MFQSDSVFKCTIHSFLEYFWGGKRGLTSVCECLQGCAFASGSTKDSEIMSAYTLYCTLSCVKLFRTTTIVCVCWCTLCLCVCVTDRRCVRGSTVRGPGWTVSTGHFNDGSLSAGRLPPSLITDHLFTRPGGSTLCTYTHTHVHTHTHTLAHT